MNEKQLYEQLKEHGLTRVILGDLVDCCPSNVTQRVNSDSFFTLDRLNLIYEYLRSDRSSNLEALELVAQVIEACYPALRSADRHLIELSPTPWQQAQILLPSASWLAAMLTALAHDRRAYHHRRTLQIILAKPDSARLEQICMDHFNMRYQLLLTQADLSELMPPTLVLDQRSVFVLGDRELRPVAAEVARYQLKILDKLLRSATLIKQLQMQGGSFGTPRAEADDGFSHVVRFATELGIDFELRLESIGDESQWLVELYPQDPQAPLPPGYRVRIYDQANRIWLESRSDYLPWQGRRTFSEEVPTKKQLTNLALELRPQEDGDAQ